MSTNKLLFKTVGVGWVCKQTGFSWCGANFTLNSVLLPLSKRCLAKNEWCFTKKCSTLAFSTSLKKKPIPVELWQKFISLFIGFCRVLYIGGWWSHHRFVSLSCSACLDHHTSPELGIIVFHKFLSVPGTTAWGCVRTPQDGCSCSTGLVFAACCGVVTLKLATATQLSSVYVWLSELATCSLVFPLGEGD